MKARTWNIAMTTAIVLLALTAVPFFSFGFEFSGDFDDFGSGDFDDFDFGDFDDFNGGDFDDFNSGDFDDFNSGDYDDADAGDPAGSDGTTPDGFDPFDDSFGPIDDDIPGNPDGTDFPPDTDDGCIVDCNPGPGDDGDDGDDDDDGDDGRLKIFIHQIFLNDPFEQEAGSDVWMRITFENDGSRDMDGTKVIVVVPDFAARDTVGPFDLDAGKQVTKTLLLELPEDVQPGTYPVRLYIHNLHTQRAVHREIEIVDYP